MLTCVQEMIDQCLALEVKMESDYVDDNPSDDSKGESGKTGGDKPSLKRQRLDIVPGVHVSKDDLDPSDQGAQCITNVLHIDPKNAWACVWCNSACSHMGATRRRLTYIDHMRADAQHRLTMNLPPRHARFWM